MQIRYTSTATKMFNLQKYWIAQSLTMEISSSGLQSFERRLAAVFHVSLSHSLFSFVNFTFCITSDNRLRQTIPTVIFITRQFWIFWILLYFYPCRTDKSRVSYGVTRHFNSVLYARSCQLSGFHEPYNICEKLFLVLNPTLNIITLKSFLVRAIFLFKLIIMLRVRKLSRTTATHVSLIVCLFSFFF